MRQRNAAKDLSNPRHFKTGIQSRSEPGRRDACPPAMPCLTMTAIVVAVVVVMTHMVAVPGLAVPRAVMKAAIAMIEALRLSSRNRQAQSGNKCQCEQFF